jgi:ParB family chromosome partitioning protein
METSKRRALGRGLAALLPPAPTARPAPEAPRRADEPVGPVETPAAPDAPPGLRPAEPPRGAATAATATATAADLAPGHVLLPLDAIRPGAAQPRRQFAEPELAALAESIAAQGLLQPVVVRRLPAAPAADTPAGPPAYELVAGERRWRAARMAGLDRIPAVVKEASDRDVLEMALVENLQREDLNPIEVAEAYRALVEDFALTQESIARRVGKQRSTVANHLRLLRLPTEIRDALRAGTITMGHARAVLGLENPALELEAFRRVLAGRLSVRETERLVQQLRAGRPAPRRSPEAGEIERAAARMAERLQRALGTKVEIRARGGRGRIVISYFSNEELDRLLERLEGRA